MKNLLALPLIALATSASAQVIIFENAETTVDFNTLISASTAPFVSNDAANLGILAARTGTGPNITATTGTANGGNLYSAGATAASDRALGTLGSGNATAGNFVFGVAFQNGSTTTSLFNPVVSFDMEQWRNGGVAAVQVVQFSYGVFATLPTLVPSLPINATDDGTNSVVPAGYTRFVAGDLISKISTVTAAALDGNLAANKTAISFTLTGVTIPIGHVLVLRFNDINHPGSDHMITLDNVKIKAVPEPASLAVLGLGLAALKRRRSVKK